jgi:CBS domain-containing protein
MIETTVGSVLNSTCLTLSHEATVTEAAWLLRDPTIGAAVVTSEPGGTLKGIITESDVVAVVAETDSQPSVTEFMSAPVITTSRSASIVSAAEKMRNRGVKHLPVVEGEEYEGLVSAATLARYLPNHQTEVEWKGNPLRIAEISGNRGVK